MTAINVAKFNGITDSMIDGIGLGIAIYFQGCHFQCPSCHNPELWSFDNGIEMNTDQIIKMINCGKHLYDSVVLLGGEPMDQPIAAMDIIRRSPIPVVLYTGFTYDELPDDVRRFAAIIVDGLYKQEESCEGFPASSNQCVYGTKKNLKAFLKNKNKPHNNVVVIDAMD